MIHCAIAGSLERFISVYLEHTAGIFPLWLSPVQIMFIGINEEKHKDYLISAAKILKENNIRVEIADFKNGLGKNVRYAKDMKYPYWVVVGDKEVAENTLTLENRNGEK